MDTGKGRSLRKLEGGWLGPVHIEERPDGTQVAVKEIRPEFLGDPQARSRLSALAAAQKQPADPGFVAVLSCTQQRDGSVAWMMPYVQAEDLVAYVKGQPDLAAKNSLRIVHEIARLLCIGEQAGFHHLALRPSQVLIAPHSAAATGLSVRLLGLGLMQSLGRQRSLNVAHAGRIYLAAEQQPDASATVDARTDVYALGVLLLYLLQGGVPTPLDVKRVSSDASPLLFVNAIRPDTARLVQRMLLPDAAQRPLLQDVMQALCLEIQESQRNAQQDPQTAAGPVTAKVTAERPTVATAPHFVATLPPLHKTTADQAPAQTIDPYTATLAPDDTADEHGTPAVHEKEESAHKQGDVVPSPPAVQSSLQHAGLLYGNFRIVRRIGRGGMGVVYEAEHQQIGRRAAVKILHPSFAARPDFATRFLNEARAVNIVRHPGLVEIFEYGQQPDGTLYIVMEFLQGESLRTLLQKQPDRYPIRRVLGWSLQIARALCATHEKGIIHRDLKPENVMVIPDPVRPGQDWVKLLDFGIAKVGDTSVHGDQANGTTAAATANLSETAAGTTMGTPVYMAPEQDSSAATVDGMADVFSFGVMLYEMIAGRRPYKDTWLGLRTTAPESLSRLRDGTPPDLSTLVLQMLALSPAERPTMTEVQTRLTQVIEQLDRTEATHQSTAPDPSSLQKGTGHRRRRGLLLARVGSLAILVALSGFLGYRMLRLPTLAEARERALQQAKRSLRSHEGREEVEALHALSKSRDSEYRPLVEPLLADARTAVVAAAARGLAEMSAVESQRALLAVLDQSQDPVVRMDIAAALAQLSHPRGLDTLRTLLQHGDAATKPEVALRLLEFGDLSGAALLHKLMEQGGTGHGTGEDRNLPVLAALARAGDPLARERLAERFQEAHSAGRVAPVLAFSLAQLGEPAARRELLRLVGQAGPDQLLSARLLSALGQTEGYGVLLAVGADDKVPERLREVAFDGLGDSGQTTAAGMLARTLDEAAVTSRFRLSAAGAILQLASGTVASHGNRSLTWARAALTSDSSATRELAVMLLGDMELDDTIPALRLALKDNDQQVRGGAARALGRKTVRAALDALSDALDDADEEVRTAGMRAIGKVATAMRSRGERNVATDVMARLQGLLARGTAVDRIVAAGVLLLLGEHTQIDTLHEGLRAANALVRRLTVELLVADTSLLQSALKDPDRQVRFAAARRLVALGLRDGVTVLRAALSEGGPDGLVAYRALLKLGEVVEPPGDLLSLFAGRALNVKEDIVDLLPDLPPAIALDLLLRSSMDASNVLRRRSAECAYSLFVRTLQSAFRLVLLGLRNDKDVIVRSRAAELISKLPVAIPGNSQSVADLLMPHHSLLNRSDKAVGKTVGSPAVDPETKPAAPSPSLSPSLSPSPSPSPTQSKPAKSASKTAGGNAGTATKDARKSDPRAKTMGLIQVFVMKKGSCQLTQQYFLPPGDHIVNVAGGTSQTVSVYAGSVIPVRQCP
ncbi:MAG: protein kinase [Myxococcales bacterium]|nr:protein kinase [Myxococcales bacterium]